MLCKNYQSAQRDREVFKINQTKIWRIDHCALKKTGRYSVGRKQQWRNLKRTALLIIVKNSHFDLWSFSNSPCIYHPSLQQWSQWSKNENIIRKIVSFIKVSQFSAADSFSNPRVLVVINCLSLFLSSFLSPQSPLSTALQFMKRFFCFCRIRKT